MHLLVRTIPTPPSPFHLRRTRACFVCRSQSRFLQSEGKEQLEPELMPNARRRKHDPLWEGDGSSLGVDLGNVRTGLAVGTSLGFPRPLTVLRMKGRELEARLVEIAEEEGRSLRIICAGEDKNKKEASRQQNPEHEFHTWLHNVSVFPDADELIVGLPTSNIGAETPQSYKVRGFVRGLAVRAADKGLRVYLQDEHGTSKDALDYMIDVGVKKSARRVQSDAYSAVILLERYFQMRGYHVELVLPNQPELRKKVRAGVQSRASLNDRLWKDDVKSEGNIFDLF